MHRGNEDCSGNILTSSSSWVHTFLTWVSIYLKSCNKSWNYITIPQKLFTFFPVCGRFLYLNYWAFSFFAIVTRSSQNASPISGVWILSNKGARAANLILTQNTTIASQTYQLQNLSNMPEGESKSSSSERYTYKGSGTNDQVRPSNSWRRRRDLKPS